MRLLRAFMAFLALACLLPGARADAGPGAAPDIVLRGRLGGADHQTYRTLPFTVPDGVARLTVEFSYDGKEQRSVIDLGLLGPDGAVVGWSGGNKNVFTVSAVEATPSYLPTPTRAGGWALLLGVPNLRKDGHADYTARIWFSRSLDAADEPALLSPPLRRGPAWYRGDLHSHTGHSDGSCASRGGPASVPCPLFLSAQAAEARGLDFVAITDHNTVSHAQAIRELQPYFANTLLMPGRELTSFQGHANLFGTLAPVDFRIVRGQRDWSQLLAGLPARALVAVNHPVRPSGEACMGCGWEDLEALRRVQAVEVVNGRDADTPYSGIPFWQAQLDRGLRLTAIGGSDNHHADVRDPLGHGTMATPTTVVYAAELSQPAIVEAIRAGHVFVDLSGTPGRLLDLNAEAGGRGAMMGDGLVAVPGETVRFSLRLAGVAGMRAFVLLDGAPNRLLPDTAIDGDHSLRFDWQADGRAHTVRAEVRDAQGKLVLLGNPIYVEAATDMPSP
jgi:hypothetical protein